MTVETSATEVATLPTAIDAEGAVASTAAAANLADAERIAALARELQTLGLRLAVARLVVRDVSARLDDDDESIDLIIDDVLRRWQERDGNDPTEIGGAGGFWNRYASRVEFAPPRSGDEFRAEFCQTGPKPFDADEYYRAVWRAHVEELCDAAGARVPVQ